MNIESQIQWAENGDRDTRHLSNHKGEHMKALALLLIALATSAHAGGGLFEKNQFETRDEARQRQSAENYDAYRSSRNEIPPTYQGPLGGTDRGAERPGYNERYDTYTRTYR